MLPIETQEAIVTNAFFAEMQKSANVLGDVIDATRFISKSRQAPKLVQKGERLIAKGKSMDAQATQILKSTPHGQRLDNADLMSGKKHKALLGSAAALGLGAAGFGYYQYKRDLNDQLAGTYTQAS